MIRTENLNKNLKEIQIAVYNKCSLNISKINNEVEGDAYDACQFQLNSMKIIFRSAKITPKKIGQFVSFWKRNTKGTTEPYSETDQFDFYVINVKADKRLGQFVFPKSELINKGIVTTEKKEGKRGFRVYPKWDKAQNKQAEKSQEWQLKFFYEIDQKIDFKKVNELYHKR